MQSVVVNHPILQPLAVVFQDVSTIGRIPLTSPLVGNICRYVRLRVTMDGPGQLVSSADGPDHGFGQC